MDIPAVLDRFDLERRFVAMPGQALEVLPRIARLIGAGNAYRIVISSSLDESSVDAAIEAEIGANEGEFEWKVFGHDRPADLLERLRTRGFEIGGKEELMAFDLGLDWPWLEDREFEVRRIDDESDLADFRTVAEEVFGKSFEPTSNELATAIREGFAGYRGFVAYADGVPAAAGRLVAHPKSEFGYLGTGGVRPAFRGQGLYRSLVAARGRDAREKGKRYLLIDAQPTSAPIVRKLGFERLTSTWPYDWKSGR